MKFLEVWCVIMNIFIRFGVEWLGHECTYEDWALRWAHYGLQWTLWFKTHFRNELEWKSKKSGSLSTPDLECASCQSLHKFLEITPWLVEMTIWIMNLIVWKRVRFPCGSCPDIFDWQDEIPNHIRRNGCQFSYSELNRSTKYSKADQIHEKEGMGMRIIVQTGRVLALQQGGLHPP